MLTVHGAGSWSRRRLQVLLAAAVVVALGLAAGGVFTIVSLLGGADAGQEASGARAGAVRGPASTPDTGAGSDVEANLTPDEIANVPFPQAAPSAARPGLLATADVGTLALPPATISDGIGVATGFPQTVEGAMAQLIAIDRTALESASLPRAQEVIAHWSSRGGPTPETWTGVAAVASLLAALEVPAEGASTTVVTLEPSMGLIKGSITSGGLSTPDVPVFVVPCALFVLTVAVRPDRGETLGVTERVAVADCQRMTWSSSDERWVIGPGDEPAPAPSIWPGTQPSIDAGYLWLDQAQVDLDAEVAP